MVVTLSRDETPEGGFSVRIWLATVGEPLPVDAGGQRLLRTGQFAKWLAERGHEVVFFTGTMDHYARRLRSPDTVTYEVAPNYHIVALAGRLYKRSISLARFRNHSDVARSFVSAADGLQPPDVVLASYPTEELCRSILDYCEPRGIPVAIDIRDFWPDIFSELLPGPLKMLAPLVFAPVERAASKTLARAAALSGMTGSAMRWAQSKARRPANASDFWFPFSYPSQQDVASVPHSGVRLVFLGTLSHRSNIETIIDAMKLLNERGVAATLDICGTGQAEASLAARAEGVPSVKFHGWIAASDLADIMARSDLGVLPYVRPDFHMSLPNKFVEYLAGGLGVLSCTEGEVRQMIETRGCGIWAASDPVRIADAIAALQPQRMKKMKDNARAVFSDTFGQDAVFGKALGCLEHIARKGAASAT